jgi:hypothetical protein
MDVSSTIPVHWNENENEKHYDDERPPSYRVDASELAHRGHESEEKKKQHHQLLLKKYRKSAEAVLPVFPAISLLLGAIAIVVISFESEIALVADTKYVIVAFLGVALVLLCSGCICAYQAAFALEPENGWNSAPRNLIRCVKWYSHISVATTLVGVVCAGCALLVYLFSSSSIHSSSGPTGSVVSSVTFDDDVSIRIMQE